MSVNINPSESRKEKAQAAVNKKAIMGEDIDLTKFTRSAEEHPYQKDPSQLTPATKSKMLEAGLMLDDPSQRVGTFIQMDNTPIHSSVKEEGVEVMPVSQAMKKHDWLADYYWKAVAVDTDKYTASVELGQNDGYFIRTLPGVKTRFPGAGLSLSVQAEICPECAQYHHRRGKFGTAYHHRLYHFSG